MEKKVRKALGVGLAMVALLATTSTYASAAPITIWSGDGGDVLVSSESPGSVTVIPVHPLWGDVSDDAGLAPDTASWISYDDTGFGQNVAPNVASRTIGSETAHFRRTFTIGGPGDLALWILVDDTADVTLTGPGGTVTLFSAFMGQIDPCAPGGTGVPIGCVEADMGVFSTTGLLAGEYSLNAYLHQTGADVFGGQYVIRYSGRDVVVPEPAALSMLGLGLIAVARQVRVRAKKNRSI